MTPTHPVILIMAGGTGGHVFPALAVAQALQARGAQIVWLGTRAGLEAEVVPRAGFPIEWIGINGLRGKNTMTLVLAPLRLAWAGFQALGIILRRRPVVVLGMGGFVTGPGGVVAWLLRLPLLIHEQNAIAGLTNRLLARVATQVLQAFPNTFSNARAPITTGNPLRAALTTLPVPALRCATRLGALRLLVVGGSLGAQALNDVVPQALAAWPAHQRPQIWHQTGKQHIDAARARYQAVGVEGRIEAFIDDMAAAYGWADLVLCRAGALTIAELACVGVAALLIPYPHAVDDHQTANAEFLVRAGAAQRIAQHELTPARLTQALNEFSAPDGRAKLLAMAERARTLAVPNATQIVADLCWQAAS